MSNAPRSVKVGEGDTLSEIASRHGFTLETLLAVNPQIHNPNTLKIGQRINLPPSNFELTIRFINMFNLPPVGVRYELLNGRISMVKGRVGIFDNEVSFKALDGGNITLMAQRIGESELQHVATFVSKREHPVMLVRINSVKLPSLTELHPKTSQPKSRDNAPAKPSAPRKQDQGLPNRQAKDSTGAAEHQILPGECACGRDMTIDELAAIFPARKKKDLEPYLEELNKMMKTYTIDSCLRKAHALAQIGHESGSLRFRAEILPKGKTEEEAYAGYKGRGLIQITWKEKYKEYGDYKGVDFMDENRLKLESYEYATDSAGWFWSHGSAYSLNEYADLNDLILISAAINGGFNGFDDRAAIFRRGHTALNAPKCKTAKNRSPDYLTFEKSKAYETRDMTFAWALWTDPESKRNGLPKDLTVSKAAYSRFLELNKASPIKRKRFGFKTTKAMIEHAEERSK